MVTFIFVFVSFYNEEPGINNCRLAKGGGGRWGGRWYGGLGKLPVAGRPTIWIAVGQGPIALAVGAGVFFFFFFLLFSIFSLLLLPLSGRRPDIDWHTVSKGR